MLIKTLAENTAISEELGKEHGLSLFIKTKRQKILFDTGASRLFADNAQKMGVDLSLVGMAVISHGHYDHGGGLKEFLALNSTARIYVNEKVFGEYYVHRPSGEMEYIGLNPELLPNDRFVFAGEQLVLDEELELFSGVKGSKYNPSGNRDLYKKTGDSFEQDDFAHEQNLLIKEGAKAILIAGCAHKGIVNILDHFYNQKGYYPSHVLGGFHLYNPSAKKHEDPKIVAKIGEYLLNTQAKFYTGHCTGLESYQSLKVIMGDQIDYLATGSELII